MDLDRYLETAVLAAKKAGLMLVQNIGSEKDISFKGDVDLVTNFDKRSQDIIHHTIWDAFPEHDIIAEEGLSKDKGSDFRWVIDPIDGTTNFAHRFPVFCISIALEKEGQPLVGAVFDPLRNELFSAKKEGGACLNEKEIKVSDIQELDKSLLATGFPYDIRESEMNNLDHFSRFAVRCQAIRRCGSAALDLCYVACGRVDGFWELKLSPWDTSAGALMVQEAQGYVTDFHNNIFHSSRHQVLASNGKIHTQMLEVLKLGNI
ncbi:MAG: inositol monophosphatase [Candidatus Aminicenantes bacterium]|nr:inositol monophosphatase [Candidatus Aminicenantes bacterium]